MARIQDEPEGTVGRRPEQLHGEPGRARPHERRGDGAEPAGAERVGRSGGALRRELAEESEVGGEIRDRERGEPTPIQGLDE